LISRKSNTPLPENMEKKKKIVVLKKTLSSFSPFLQEGVSLIVF